MNKDFNIILKKLQKFEKKYYLYQMIQGLLVLVLILIFVFLILSLIEYQLFMTIIVKKILFYNFLIFFLLITIHFILIPFLKFLGWIKTKKKGKLTEIIKKHFPEIKDKLINVIELQSINNNEYSVEILEAAVSQKSKDLKILNFKEAISFKNLKQISLYLVCSIIVILIIVLSDKEVIVEPGNRIIHFNQEYIKPSPYDFIVKNKELDVKKGKNFKILITCKGKEIPDIVYINIEGNDFLMKSTENGCFEYEIASVINNVEFYFTDLKYISKKYLLKVIAVPIINNFSIDIIPPVCTGLKSQKFENLGDLKIPCGTEVIWNFRCYDTDSMFVLFKDGLKINSKKEEKNLFNVKRTILKSTDYNIFVKSKETEYESIMNFKIDEVEDLYPEIEISQIEDSVFKTKFYFKGKINDDYGFSDLSFHLKTENLDSVISLKISKNVNEQNFYYSTDLKDFNLKGKEISYYFSVTDNDCVNKPKTTVSKSFNYKFPDEKEIYKKEKEDFSKIENLISESHKISDAIKKEINDLKEKNINKSSLDWEKSQMIQDINSKRNSLEDILDQIKKINKESNNYQNTFSEKSEEIIKKQKEIQNLLENVMNEDLKKLLDEFSKLADKYNLEKLNQITDQVNVSIEDLSKQLERNLEMLKRMKIEQNIEQQIKRLKELKEKEENESKSVLDVKKEDLKNNLNDLKEDSEELDNIEEKIEEINKENNELKKPLIFDDFKKEIFEIKENMKNSKKEIERENKEKVSESFHKTGEKIGELIFSMEQILNSNKNQQKGENLSAIRKILKNLLYLSLNQENVLNNVKKTSENDPVLRNEKKNQKVLLEQSQVIKDSLYALAERSPKIGSVVNEEIVNLEINLKEALKFMDEDLYSQALVKQQTAMTSANNLALFLSEIIKQMESSENNSESSNENCQDGKGSKMNLLKKSAGDLQNQLKDIIEKLKSGDGKNISRELSESLMQHEIIQKMLRDLMNGGDIGDDTKNQLQKIDQLLDKNRIEIINKRIDQNIIQRNKEILVRLLEAEKSENERDFDNKRESNTADKKFYSNPAKYFEKKESKNTTLENLQRKNLKLTDFYNEKQRVYLEKCKVHGIK